MKSSTKNLVLSGLFLAFGIVLPFFTAQVPSIGNKLLPMHIPVLLCGFICGWPYGLFIGLILPVFRSMLFGMPPMFPTAVAMTFELAVYGLASGLLFKLLPKKNVFIYVTLVISMICGRMIWGAASVLLFGIAGKVFSMELFMAGAIINAIPGIVIQLIIIPIIIIALRKANLIKNE